MDIREEKQSIAEDKLLKLLEGYPSYMVHFYEYIKDKKYTTRRKYIIDVLHMLNYVRGDKYVGFLDVLTITTGELENYMKVSKYRVVKGGKTKKLGNAGLASRWSAISCFFQFMKKECGLENDPFTEFVERPKIKEIKQKSYLSKGEIKALLERVGKRKDVYFRNRDLAIITLVLSTGIKEKYLSELNIEDVDFKNQRIVIQSKDGYYIYPAKIAMNYISEWLMYRKIFEKYNNVIKTEALFVNQEYRRMTPHSYIYMLKIYSDIFNKNITLEMLRGSCIAHLYNETQDAFLTVKATGLSNLRDLERYVMVEVCENNAGIVMDEFLSDIMSGKEKDEWEEEEEFWDELGEKMWNYGESLK